MPLQSIFASISPYLRRIRNGLIFCGTIYVILLLGAAWTGFGKVGSALPPGTSPYEQMRRSLHTNYVEALADESPVVHMRAQTVASILCTTIGELCSEELSAAPDTSSYIHHAANVLAVPFSSPPASGVAWLGDTLEHVGFVPKSYAQGIGFSALGSYREVWKIMRDAAFLLITLVIVISGFIIIFGIKVGEKAGVAIEEMLPRLVIVLIMISLSYAIVGFMIDLMYIVMFIAFSVMAPILHLTPEAYSRALNSIATGSPGSLWSLVMSQDIAANSYIETGKALFSLMPTLFQGVVSAITSQVVPSAMVAIVGSMVGGVGGIVGKFASAKGASSVLKNAGEATKGFGTANFARVINFISGKETVKVAEDTKTTIASLILAIGGLILTAIETFGAPMLTPYLVALLLVVTNIYLFFKLYFMIFSAYVEIIINMIFAPLFIMLHALPGSKNMYTWFKSLAVNLLIFPAVLVLLMISGFVSNAKGPHTTFDNSGNFWAPPFLNSIGSQSALQSLIGGLIFYNIPIFIDEMKKALGYEKGAFSNIKISSFAAPAIGFVTSSFGAVKSVSGFAHQMRDLGATGAAIGDQKH
ncbi:MAG: hypothetical protein WCJ70_04930 [bacterium]